MPTADAYSRFEFTANGKLYTFGSRGNPVETTVDGYIKEFTRSLLNNTTLDIWEAGAEEIGDFELLGVKSTQAVYLELTADKNASFGTVVFAFKIPANFPFILPSDDAYANYSADFGGGTVDVIDRIRIRNISGSTAVVEGMFVT